MEGSPMQELVDPEGAAKSIEDALARGSARRLRSIQSCRA